MNAGKLRKAATLAVVVVVILVVSMARPAAAQERPGPVTEFAAGSLLFADDGVVAENFVGGSARFYVLPRVSVGPEVAFIRGEHHSHLMLTGNVTFDFISPINGQPRPITPFAVVGGGLFSTRELFPNDRVFTSTEGGFTGGGGVRALIGRHVVVGAEARIGWELHIRVNGMVGVRFDRSGSTRRNIFGSPFLRR